MLIASIFMIVLQLSMLEDPTAPEEEGERETVLKQLVYLLSVPQELEQNVTFLLNWAKARPLPVITVYSQSFLPSCPFRAQM